MRQAALLFGLFLCGPLWAAPVSQDYLCIQGHEQEAATKLQTFIRESLTRFFDGRRIAINASALQVKVSRSTQTGGDTPPYVSFTGNAAGGASALSASSVVATAVAHDGTKFNVLLSSGSDNQDAAEYRDVRYEDLVNNLEGVARRIIAHCRLDWDARCLDFHRTNRPIVTASATQVRRPIYRDSVGRWRRYTDFLGPLLAELPEQERRSAE